MFSSNPDKMSKLLYSFLHSSSKEHLKVIEYKPGPFFHKWCNKSFGGFSSEILSRDVHIKAKISYAIMVQLMENKNNKLHSNYIFTNKLYFMHY